MTKTTNIRQRLSGAATVVITIVTAVLLASCSISSSSVGTLAEDQHILATCDATHPPTSNTNR